MERITALICTLAERGLPFRGDNEQSGSPNSGNYLDLLEVLAKFDPFLLIQSLWKFRIRKSLLFVKNYLRRDDSAHGQKS